MGTGRGRGIGQGLVTVVVQARPVQTAWDTGDGATVVCANGPGVAWAPGMADADTYCSHTFAAAGDDLAGSATSTWTFRWWLNGNDMGDFGDFTRTTAGRPSTSPRSRQSRPEDRKRDPPMTTTLRPRPSASRNAKATPNRFDLDPPTTGSARSKWPEVTVGLLVLAVFALVATWFYSSTSDREPVLALRSPDRAGPDTHRRRPDGRRRRSEQAVNAVSADQAAALVGQIALVDLSPGTLAVERPVRRSGRDRRRRRRGRPRARSGRVPHASISRRGTRVRIVATADTERRRDEVGPGRSGRDRRRRPDRRAATSCSCRWRCRRRRPMQRRQRRRSRSGPARAGGGVVT